MSESQIIFEEFLSCSPSLYLGECVGLRLITVVNLYIWRKQRVTKHRADGRVGRVQEVSSTRVSHQAHILLPRPLRSIYHDGGEVLIYLFQTNIEIFNSDL